METTSWLILIGGIPFYWAVQTTFGRESCLLTGRGAQKPIEFPWAEAGIFVGQARKSTTRRFENELPFSDGTRRSTALLRGITPVAWGDSMNTPCDVLQKEDMGQAPWPRVQQAKSPVEKEYLLRENHLLSDSRTS